LFWAWGRVSPNLDPTLAVARSIQRRAILDLRSAEPAGRIEAVRTLERLTVADDSASVGPLIGAMEDPVAEVRVAAIRALGAIIAELQRASQAEGPAVATIAATIGRRADPDEGVRVAAIRTLGSIASGLEGSETGADAVRAATKALIDGLEDPAPRVRSAATSGVASLARTIGPEVVKGLLAEMLGDPDAGVRREAIEALNARLWGEVPPEGFAKALQDASAENRGAAVFQLTSYRRGLDSFLPVVLRLAEHDPDFMVRERSISALGLHYFGPPALTTSSLPALIAGLKSKDSRLRARVATILGDFRRDALAAVPDLLLVLKKPPAPETATAQQAFEADEPVCRAAEALGKIAPGSAAEGDVVAALLEFARFSSPTRRASAAFALIRFKTHDEDAAIALDGANPGHRLEREAAIDRAITAIAPGTHWAGEAVSALLPGLRSSSWRTRARTVETLSCFAPRFEEAVDGVRSLKDDPDAAVRSAVAKALAAIDADAP
jgi:HEAT repeat protein